MSNKKSKFREILKIGSAVAKPFVPGSVGSILDAVNGHLDPKTGKGTDVEKALQTLAEDNDAQSEAILALHERVKKLEAK
jgi:hypothetical protein